MAGVSAAVVLVPAPAPFFGAMVDDGAAKEGAGDDDDDDAHEVVVMTMVVEAETRAPPYLARQMSRLAYADIGDEHTPILFGSGNEGILASAPP